MAHFIMAFIYDIGSIAQEIGFCKRILKKRAPKISALLKNANPHFGSEVLFNHIVTVPARQIGQFSRDLVAVFEKEPDVPIVDLFGEKLDRAFLFGLLFKMLE